MSRPSLMHIKQLYSYVSGNLFKLFTEPIVANAKRPSRLYERSRGAGHVESFLPIKHAHRFSAPPQFRKRWFCRLPYSVDLLSSEDLAKPARAGRW